MSKPNISSILEGKYTNETGKNPIEIIDGKSQITNDYITWLEDLNKNDSFWDDNMVIDFVNWYIELHNLDFRFTLENRTIIDTFKDKFK